MDKKAFLRQFISPFIQGPNFDAILESLADEAQKQEDLSIAVNNQLTISTSSGIYLDKNMSAIGITRPPELGMEDLAFKQMGIQVNAQKQITESIHAILSTFYGDDTVRAYATSGIAGPYELADGDDLIFALEDGKELTLILSADEFEYIQSATADELANVITRFIRSNGYNGYAQKYLDIDTNLEYVRIYGGAKGPYSQVQVLGGRVQNQLEFSIIRNTFLPSNTTVWQITRNIGSTYRFRWESGPKPLLDQVFVGDKVMIYGQQFQSVGINGTFQVTQVKPPSQNPAYNAGYFEIEILDYSALKSSIADQEPPADPLYQFSLTQNSFDDLKFFLPKKNTPYSQIRYSLAWEPKSKLLKIYMPATTKIVRREIIGAAHLHLLYGKGEFNGAWGSTTDENKKIEIVSDRVIKFRQNGSDAIGYEGTLNSTPIEYVSRENGYTTVICSEPHGLIGIADKWNRIISDEIVSLNVTNMLEDDPVYSFNGPYIIDPTAPYTLTSQIVYTREKIVAGEIKQTILIDGNLPTDGGYIVFDLNKDTRETVKYLSCQTVSSLSSISIVSISQLGTTVTVTTDGPHGVIIGQKASITNTVNFNGNWTVTATPTPNIYIFEKNPPANLYEASGTSTPVLPNALSTLVLDPSYFFKYTHDIQSDATYISDTKAYEPSQDGSDYGLYLTGTSEARVFAEELIRSIVAAGINMEIVIIYPSDVDLGNMGGSSSSAISPTSEKVTIWGPDDI